MKCVKINRTFFAVTFYFLTTTTRIQSSDILVIFPTTAQSHYRVVRPLIHGLLERGHKILAITNFPDADDRANLSHINIAGIKPHSKIDTGKSIMNSVSSMPGKMKIYASILDHPPVVSLLRSGRKFDLVIAEYFTTTPIFAPISAMVDAPIIGFCPMSTFPKLHELMGVESTLAYTPTMFNHFSDRNSFTERLSRLVSLVLTNIISKWLIMPTIQKINKQYYGIQTDSLEKLMCNISVVLINNCRSTAMAVPSVPGIVEVGGIHIKDEQRLSQEYIDFMDDADHGVILFSLGSVVSESSLGTDKLNSIIDTFSRLKQKIIMKFDLKGYTMQLPNVKVVKWLPQRDLLAHPKVLLFISHAGIMSMIETIHCGKPMIAIPIFGDQPYNADILVKKKVAVSLEYQHLTSDQLYNAVNEVLTEKYKNNVKKLQELFNDRPQSPLETAIFWTEYAIRHRNESNNLLKSPRIHLNFNQACLIDVFAALILPIVLVGIICWKYFLRIFF